MDPIDPLPNVTTHSLVGELTAEAIDEAVAVAALRTRPS